MAKLFALLALALAGDIYAFCPSGLRLRTQLSRIRTRIEENGARLSLRCELGKHSTVRDVLDFYQADMRGRLSDHSQLQELAK